jgi:hypothetical protein
MNDYIKQLEATVENLQELLAKEQTKIDNVMPEWRHFDKERKSDTTIAICSYIIGNCIYGYITDNITAKYTYYGKTKFGFFEGDDIDNMKKCIENEYKNLFLKIVEDSEWTTI